MPQYGCKRFIDQVTPPAHVWKKERGGQLNKTDFVRLSELTHLLIDRYWQQQQQQQPGNVIGRDILLGD